VLRAQVAPRPLAAAAFGLALAVMATAPWWRPVTLGLPYPLLQWADAAAPVLVGVFALGAGQWPRRVALAMAAVLVATATALCAHDWVGTPYAVGLAASLFVLLRAPGPSSAGAEKWTKKWTEKWALKAAPLTDCAFGVYLSHSLVFALLLGVPGLPADALPLAIFSVALAATWALRRRLPRAAAYLT
jgi:hypothetical protein